MSELSSEPPVEVYTPPLPEFPDISLMPGSEAARAKGCICVGRHAGTEASYVHPDCPLGHGTLGWGLGEAKPGSPYANDQRLLRKYWAYQLANDWQRWIPRGYRRR